MKSGMAPLIAITMYRLKTKQRQGLKSFKIYYYTMVSYIYIYITRNTRGQVGTWTR